LGTEYSLSPSLPFISADPDAAPATLVCLPLRLLGVASPSASLLLDFTSRPGLFDIISEKKSGLFALLRRRLCRLGTEYSLSPSLPFISADPDAAPATLVCLPLRLLGVASPSASLILDFAFRPDLFNIGGVPMRLLR